MIEIIWIGQHKLIANENLLFIFKMIIEQDQMQIKNLIYQTKQFLLTFIFLNCNIAESLQTKFDFNILIYNLIIIINKSIRFFKTDKI